VGVWRISRDKRDAASVFPPKIKKFLWGTAILSKRWNIGTLPIFSLSLSLYIYISIYLSSFFSSTYVFSNFKNTSSHTPKNLFQRSIAIPKKLELAGTTGTTLEPVKNLLPMHVIYYSYT
jgi:hypothetical protein